MLLGMRASKPPLFLLRLPNAHTEAVDSSDVVSVGALPKIGCRSSIGIRKWPIVARPQLPCSPTNVSRLARPELDELPVSPDTFDSIWNTAFNPPPRLSVPRMPKRDEFELTRLVVVFDIAFGAVAELSCEHTTPPWLWLPPVFTPALPAPLVAPFWQVLPLTNSRSIFKRPYSVTFAVWACAASGNANALPTARATSFLFMVSPLTIRFGKKTIACHRNLLRSSEKLT